MNKQDFWLIILLLIIGGGFWCITSFIKVGNANKAYVYYDNNLIKTIDLNGSVKEYTVNGYNGDVVIEAGQNKIRVKEEKSPRHICSKQGWVTSSFEPIVCLPNKIIIRIESANQEIDAVVR